MSEKKPGTPCAVKVRYLTKGQAKTATRRVRSRNGKLRAYKCPGCGFWHMGHQPILVTQGVVARGDWRIRETEAGL